MFPDCLSPRLQGELEQPLCREMRGWGSLEAGRCRNPGRLCKVPVRWLGWPGKGAPGTPSFQSRTPSLLISTSASCVPLHPLPFLWLLQPLLPIRFSILFSSSSGPPPPGSQHHPSYAVLPVLLECLLSSSGSQAFHQPPGPDWALCNHMQAALDEPSSARKEGGPKFNAVRLHLVSPGEELSLTS